MSVEATTAAWARRDVTSTEKLVLVRIADHAGPDGSDAWPSVARLVRDTGLSERAVQGAIKSLESKGALTRQIGTGPHGTNRYKVSLKPVVPPQQVPPASPAPPQDVHPTPAGRAPQGGQDVHPNRHLNHQEPSRARRTVNGSGATFDALFAEWYQTYPKHRGREAAKAKYVKAIKAGVDHAVLLEGARRYRDDPSRTPKFTKDPATWLNQGCWDDEYEAAPSGEVYR